VVATDTLKVLSEHQTDQGIRTLFHHFQQQSDLEQFQFFERYLSEQVSLLPVSEQSYPLIVSGMASSSIGLQELPYADFPFNPEGIDLATAIINLSGGTRALLVSGVKSSTGMIRGEEVQAMGLSDHLSVYGEGVLLLPGTHSKHMLYAGGKFVALTNFMTGELFEVLSQRSILASSVQKEAWSDEVAMHFRDGLQLGFAGDLTASLLMVRARDVIRKVAPSDNYFFLSGLLIGDEVRHLKPSEGSIFLAAPDPLFTMYRMALQSFFDKDKLVLFDGAAMETALLIGHKKIMLRHAE